MPALSSAASASSVGSDQAAIAKLEEQVTAQGARIKSLVTRSNEVQAHIDALDVETKRTEKLVAADLQAEAAAAATARRVAIGAYVGGAADQTPALRMFADANDTSAMLAGQVYASAINSKLTEAISELRTARARTKAARRTLGTQRDQAKHALDDLASARKDAEGAIASEQALLTHARGDLVVHLAQAAAEKRKAEQAAAEQELAARRVSSSPPPVLPPISPRPGSYSNPMRGVAGLNPERIDQGVDFSGFGPIFAIGNGVVLSTTVGGWPGGTFISYRLTDGPAAGLAVFVAEDIQPQVSVGMSVNANTVLGQLYSGPDGMETGWADPSAIGNTMARSYGQYGGGNSTAFGANFSRLLQAVGAPPGILQNNPPTGSLPAGWPSW